MFYKKEKDNNEKEVKVVKLNKGWDIKKEVEKTTECGEVHTPKIVLKEEVYDKIVALMKEFSSSEWMAYLIGRKEEERFVVEDLHVPEQEVSSSYCESKEVEPNGSIGMIHSHHSMGAFFSGTDDSSINLNNELSIVVSNKGGSLEFLCSIRLKTPCGKYIFKRTSTVEVEMEDKKKEWVEAMKKKIKDRITTTNVLSYYGYGYYDDYRDYYNEYYKKLYKEAEKETKVEKETKAVEYEENYLDNFEEVDCPVCKGTGAGEDGEYCQLCGGWGVLYRML